MPGNAVLKLLDSPRVLRSSTSKIVPVTREKGKKSPRIVKKREGTVLRKLSGKKSMPGNTVLKSLDSPRVLRSSTSKIVQATSTNWKESPRILKGREGTVQRKLLEKSMPGNAVLKLLDSPRVLRSSTSKIVPVTSEKEKNSPRILKRRKGTVQSKRSGRNTSGNVKLKRLEPSRVLRSSTRKLRSSTKNNPVTSSKSKSRKR